MEQRMAGEAAESGAAPSKRAGKGVRAAWALLAAAPLAVLGVAVGMGWLRLPDREPEPPSWSGGGGVVPAGWTPASRPSDAPVLPEDERAGLRFAGEGPDAPTVRMEMAAGAMAKVLESYRRQAEAEGWHYREDWGERMRVEGGGRAIAFRKDGRLRVVRVGEADEGGSRAVLVYESRLLGM